MTQMDADLQQLRLIDAFLEDGNASLAEDAFDAEVEQAVIAATKSKLHRIRAVFEREKDDTWKASLRNARLLFGKSDAF